MAKVFNEGGNFGDRYIPNINKVTGAEAFAPVIGTPIVSQKNEEVSEEVTPQAKEEGIKAHLPQAGKTPAPRKDDLTPPKVESVQPTTSVAKAQEGRERLVDSDGNKVAETRKNVAERALDKTYANNLENLKVENVPDFTKKAEEDLIKDDVVIPQVLRTEDDKDWFLDAAKADPDYRSVMSYVDEYNRKNLYKSGNDVVDFQRSLHNLTNNFSMEYMGNAMAYANAKKSTADDNDIVGTMSDVMNQFHKGKVLSEEQVFAKVPKQTDKYGDEYYQMGDGRIYGEDNMRQIIGHFVGEHNHKVMMADSAEYREAWAQKNFGTSYEEVVKRQHARLQKAVNQAVAAVNAFADPLWDEMEEQGFLFPAQAEALPYRPETRAGIESIKLRLKLNDLLENDFWSGAGAASIDAIETAIGSWNSVISSAETRIALDKQMKGEPLSQQDLAYIALWEVGQELERTRDELSRNSTASNIGSDVATGFGYAASMGKTFFLGGASGISKLAYKQLLKSSVSNGFKKAGKLAIGVADNIARSGARAALSTMPMQNFADRRLNQYQLDNFGRLIKNETNPLADMYKAYASATGEIFFENGVGGLIDKGLGMFGRTLAQTKFVNWMSGTKPAIWARDFTPLQGAHGFVRGLGINSLPGEMAEEYATAIFEPFITGEGFTLINEKGYMPFFNQYYADVFSSKFALETFAVCGAMSVGFGGGIRGISGAYNAMAISNLRNKTTNMLENIGNERLRNELYVSMSSATPNFANVAKINWGEKDANGKPLISPADTSLAAKVVFNGSRVAAMRGELNEARRLNAFAPALQSALDTMYKGKDMASPIASPEEAMKIIDVYELNADGLISDRKVGNVIFGDINDRNGIVQVADRNGTLSNLPTANYGFVEQDISDFIAEQYNLMFSKDITQERLDEIIHNVHAYRRMDAESKKKVLAENGFSLYKAGANVTLADGRQGVVQGDALNGKYIVEVTDADGKNKQSVLAGFETILNENDIEMAQAQAQAMAEGRMDAPIPLPSTKDGRVSLDNVNDSEALAEIAPSVFGSKANAVAALDRSLQQMMAVQEQIANEMPAEGLDAVTEQKKRAESIANRIEVLQDARKRLAGSEYSQQTTEDKEAERNERQAKQDAMSTFEFSREYRMRNLDSVVARNALARFAKNATDKIAQIDAEIAQNEKAIAEREAQLDEAYNQATSEVDMENIAEQNSATIKEIEGLISANEEKAKERGALAHRKAQYEQTLKDMAGKNVDTIHQAGTIGTDKRVAEFAEKASKILGMPVVVTEGTFTNSMQNGVHRVDENGKSAIYINPNASVSEQGVGILAHEIVHELKTVLNKKEWAKLETHIMGAVFGRRWRGSEGYQSLIDSIQQAEKRAGHEDGLDNEKVREEAVAYTIQDLIFAGERGVKAMEAIFADPDTKWTGKIRTVFKNILAKIKSLFATSEAVSDSKELQDAVKAFEEALHRVEEKKKAGYNYAKRAKKDASGKELHSLATFHDWVDDRGVMHKGTRTMFIERMNANGFSDKQKADMVARMDTAYEYMVKLQEFTDEDGNLRFDAFNEWAKTTPHYKQIGRDYVKAITSLVSNGDYPINLELTTDCIKREAFTALVNELAKRGVNMSAMRPAQIMVLQNLMQQYGIEVACKLCFVEGKRLGIVNWAETIVQDWNDALIEAGIDTDEYFDFGKDGEVTIPTTPLREIETGHEQKVAWDAIFEIDLIMEGQDPKVVKAQMRKNLKEVEKYKKQRAEEWANKTKKPRNPADWKPTKDDQKHIDELMSQGVTVAQVGKNASEYREAFNRMREAWIEKNPKKDPLSFNPTKKQWDALDKIRNREIATVKGKMVRLIMEHPEMRKKMQLKDLLGSKGLMEIRNQDGEAFADLWSIILQRFGTGTPKPIQDATPYDGEIMGLTESQFDKANKIGGARLFSFSDFDITKIFDYMQMFFDLEANKQMLQSYTKEVAAVIALGRSNAKMNISTLANADVPAEVKVQYEKANADGKKALRHKMSENAGLLLDEDGKIVGINFSKEHSVKPEFAQEIFHDDTRNKDCGAIMVGDSVNHAIYSAAQDWIRMVIPFHLSGIPLAAREKADTLWYFDNTAYQSTRKRSGEEGWSKLGTADKDFEFYNDMDKKGWNMRDKAREYIAWCEERGYRPKFDWGINSDYYRAFCEQEGFTPNQQIIDMMDADTENGVWRQYYKFLTDFTAYKPVFNEKDEMIDEIPSPQLPIKATFDFSEMEREVLFEGEDSMLAHREDNIKRTQEHIGELADKATAFLLGEVTEEELGLRDDVHYENYADAEKYLEAKANSLQKRPNTQEVVSEVDVVESSFSISRNNEATIDKWLGKREDFADEVKNAFKEYIADFKPATQLATTKWFANGVIRIPEDMPKVEQAMEIAQKAKVDALQFKSPMEIIAQFGDVFKPKEKLINPDDVPTLSNKVQVPNTDITIYDVEDSEESRKNFRELMNSHFGKNANPWCLMQAENGVLTEDSKDYWNQYNKYPKRAAFKGGKLIAFFASADEPTWWSRMDKPYSGIPITRKIEGDALGRSATYIVSEDGGLDSENYTYIHRGNQQNGLYEEWYDLDTKKFQVTYKDGKIDGVEEGYFKDGRIAYQLSYKNGKRDGKYLVFHSNGGLLFEGAYKEGLNEGLVQAWHKNGNLHWRGNYIKGVFDGIVESWDENGDLETREEYENGSAIIEEHYANGKLNGWTTRWNKDGDIVSREYYVDGKRNKLKELGRKFTESFSIDRSQSAEEIAEPRTEQESFSVNREDADGNRIGDGSMRENYAIVDFSAYPQISYNVQKAIGTESVYVIYTNEENGKSATVRFSGHESNAVRFGQQLRGHNFHEQELARFRENDKDLFIDKPIKELMHRLGLIDKEIVTKYAPKIETRYVSKAKVANGEFDIVDVSLDKLRKLPVGTDISQYVGKVIKDRDLYVLIESDRVLGRPYSVTEYSTPENGMPTMIWNAQKLEPRSSFSLSLEDTDTIFATAKEEFASTNDWKKTGWLMPDGTQLDFAEGGDYRGTDHRAIGAAYKGKAEHQWQYLQDFENRGGIRIHMNRDGKYGTIEMTIKPTAEQKKRLRSFIGAVGGNVDVDFMDENYNTAHSASYEGVSPARVLSGITAFYDEGIKPKGNVSYSLSREDGNKVSLNDIAEGILDYDAKNGTELFDWLTFIEDGTIGENKTKFFVANAGEILNKYGIKGEINVTRRVTNMKRHTNNDDHNLGVKEWADVILSINNPILITRYNNEANAYRIYTLALINGKNICVGVDVNAENGVEITRITTAFGRDIRKAYNSKVEDVLFDKQREKTEEQPSGSDNSHLYAQQPFDSKDTTTNPKNQISEQDSFSLNRDNTSEVADNVLAVTPEMEAEANEATSSQEAQEEMQRLSALEDLQKRYAYYRKKISSQREKRLTTFDEVKKFLNDMLNMEGLQEATAGQYRKIVNNVLKTLLETPTRKYLKVEDVLARVDQELTVAKTKIANSALTAATKDFKAVIKKKREGKNSRGEAIQKYVSDEARLIVEDFLGIINPLFRDGEKVDYDRIMNAGKLLEEVDEDGNRQYVDVVNRELQRRLDEVEEKGETNKRKGVINLLTAFARVKDAAQEARNTILNIEQLKAQTDQERKDALSDEALAENKELEKISHLLDAYYGDSIRVQGNAWRTLKNEMGFRTIGAAEARRDELQERKRKRDERLEKTDASYYSDLRAYENQLANEKMKLVVALKEFNVALLSVDKEGRAALKAELVIKRAKQGEFKKGIYHSIRSPHYRNVASKHNEQADKLPHWQRRDMIRRGQVVWADVAETFEFLSRRADRMSIPGEWLPDGWYYQFILHPTEGILARADWRFKTEKKLRKELDEVVRQYIAPNQKKFGVDDLKKRLKEKIYHPIEVVEMNSNGEVVHGGVPTTVEMTLGQMLYIRAMVAQEGGINGYLTLGLTEAQVEEMLEMLESTYPEYCALDDHIRGENGILEKLYAIRNDIYRNIYGRDLDHTEGYFPIQRKGNREREVDVSGDTINRNTIAGGIGSNKKRVRNSAPMDIDVDYFEKLDRHISESMRWSASAELIEKMNVLLSSPNFRAILKAQNFSIDNLKKAFLRAIGERMGGVDGETSKAGRIINSMAKNAVVSNVAFNLNSALKQLASLSAIFSNELNPKLWWYFAKNVTSMPAKTLMAWASSKLDNEDAYEQMSLPVIRGCYNWAKENIPTFAERVDSGNMGFDIFEQDGIEKWDQVASYAKKYGMMANVFMDSVACAILTKTYYDYHYDRNREKKMSEQEAHDDARMRAANLMNQTQQSSQGAYVSSMQSDKMGGFNTFLRAGFGAYQNSQLGFDRNMRASLTNIFTMTYDMFGKEGAYEDVISAQAAVYESRGWDSNEARKQAKKDYRRAYHRQFNTFLHNTIINNVLWVATSAASTFLSKWLMYNIAGWFMDGDENDEAMEVSYDHIKEEIKKDIISWWTLAELVPATQSILRPLYETAKTAFKEGKAPRPQHMVTLSPLMDLIGEGVRLGGFYDKKDEEGVKAQWLALGFALVDVASRYGVGVSSETIRRSLGGFVGLVKGDGGRVEDMMNILSAPRSLTKLIVGAPRKDETMDDYAKRVAGMYQLINRYNKGENIFDIRNQYIDKMDELLFHNTDFDYAKYKEDKKKVDRFDRANGVFTVTFRDTKKGVKSSEPAVKENRVGILLKTPQEAIEPLVRMANYKGLRNYLENQLDKIPVWDNEGAKARTELIKNVQNFNNEYLKSFEDYQTKKEQHELNRLNKDE